MRHRNEDLYASFVENAPLAVLVCDEQGIIQQANPAACRLFGYARAELLQSPLSLLCGDDARNYFNQLNTAFNNHAAVTLSCRTKNGQPLLANFTPSVSEQAGEPRMVASFIHSITDLSITHKNNVQGEVAADANHALLNSTTDLMWSVDTSCRLLAANSAFSAAMVQRCGTNIMAGEQLLHLPALPQQGITEWKALYHRAFAGEAFKQEICWPAEEKTNDRWSEVSFNPIMAGQQVSGVVCYARDISDQKAAELFLRDSEEKRRLIMNAALDAIICINTEGYITFWNPQASSIFGWSEEEAIGQLLSTLIVPERFRRYHDEGMKNYLKTGKGAALNVLLELEAIKRNGEIFPIELTVLPINQRDEPFFCAFIRDITQRKKSEEAILLSNERYNIVAQTTNDSIWDWDLITNEVVRPGKKLENILGYNDIDAAEVDAFWRSHVHAEDWKRMEQERKLLFSDPEARYWQDEYRFLKPDGAFAYVSDKGYIFRDKEGRAIRMIGASRDISGEKQRMLEVLRIQQNLDSLINTTDNLIWSVDTECHLITANRAYVQSIEQVFGYTVREGDSVFLSGLPAALVEKWRRYYTRALEGETFSIEEGAFSAVNNNWWYSIVSFSPIISKDNRITGVACFAKDVTDLKTSAAKLEELNEQLVKKADELAVSNSELEQFAYVASHDLQEPLRMITGFLTQLEKKYAPLIDERGKRYIDFAVDGAKRMRQIILDLLEFSRAGKKEDKQEAVDLNALLADICILFRTEIEKTNANVQIADLPVVHASKSALRQVFQNLVGNALKYHKASNAPFIEVGVKDAGSYWQFMVADNGIGISSEYFATIFVLFQRLHSKDEYPGTGMGLALSKKIIENAGGKIWVESTEGEGSKFYFTVKK